MFDFVKLSLISLLSLHYGLNRFKPTRKSGNPAPPPAPLGRYCGVLELRAAVVARFACAQLAAGSLLAFPFGQ